MKDFVNINIDIMNDPKIKILREMPDGDILFTMWIGILCLSKRPRRLGIVEIGHGIPICAEQLSTALDIPLGHVKTGLYYFAKLKMIETIEGTMHIINFRKYN